MESPAEALISWLLALVSLLSFIRSGEPMLNGQCSENLQLPVAFAPRDILDLRRN